MVVAIDRHVDDAEHVDERRKTAAVAIDRRHTAVKDIVQELLDVVEVRVASELGERITEDVIGERRTMFLGCTGAQHVDIMRFDRHPSRSYSPTGMGLTLARKVVVLARTAALPFALAVRLESLTETLISGL